MASGLKLDSLNLNKAWIRPTSAGNELGMNHCGSKLIRRMSNTTGALRKPGSERSDELKRRATYYEACSAHIEGVTSTARLVDQVLAVFVREGCHDEGNNAAFHRALPAGNSGIRGAKRNSWAPAAISRRQQHAQGENCSFSGPSKKELSTVLSKGSPLFPYNMALTLPLETLSNLKVSFRCRLPDGAFEFHMVPGNTPDISCVQRGGGITLHLDAVRDSTGVTLTLATSGQLSSSPDDDGSDAVLRRFSGQSLDYSTSHSVPQSTEVRSIPDFGTDSRSALTSEPLPVSQGLQDHIFESTDIFGPTNFDDTLLDCFNLGYNSHHNPSLYVPGLTRIGGWTVVLSVPGHNLNLTKNAEFEDSKESSSSNSPITLETPVTTPTASSESPISCSSPSRSGRGRSKVPCPNASCGRYFANTYTLSKHIKAHEPKAREYFQCTMGCPMGFSRRHDRLRHEVTQHGRVCEWGCNACSVFFSSEFSLKKHKCKNLGRTKMPPL
ncbi:hypothetical protein B0H17DRAFT_1134703 [Mycena rosella]|uniref:C2H2-type domain-containing protein n=1 Tax=Mycena rosella TaxID=1033263 RepID=A0AAD7DFL5_MYCRO|nr:hypothetical protein B0H17DRAFT_1134703 [Mycena rosella]